MNKIKPAVFVWTEVDFVDADGEVVRVLAMVPLRRFRPMCSRQFAVSEEYPLTLVENRSLASHNHYFASVQEAWDNLNEESAKHFPSAEHLRKWALVQAGYCDEENHVFDTSKDAKVFVTGIRKRDQYAVIKWKGGQVVQIFTAESQSMASMRRERFEQSKRDVLAILAPMARTTPAQLKKEAARRVPPPRRATGARA